MNRIKKQLVCGAEQKTRRGSQAREWREKTTQVPHSLLMEGTSATGNSASQDYATLRSPRETNGKQFAAGVYG